MANNGLLFISSVGKIQTVCQSAAKFVRKVLYVNIKGKSDYESTLPAISKQIDTFYAKVIVLYTQ